MKYKINEEFRLLVIVHNLHLSQLQWYNIPFLMGYKAPISIQNVSDKDIKRVESGRGGILLIWIGSRIVSSTISINFVCSYVFLLGTPRLIF